MEFYVAVIILGASVLWNIMEIFFGLRGPSEYLQTHFIVKNKVLLKFAIIKPMRDPRIGNKRQEVSIFNFAPYILSLLLTMITGVLTIIYGITGTEWIGPILTSKITLIVLVAYSILLVIKTCVLTTVDYSIFNRECK